MEFKNHKREIVLLPSGRMMVPRVSAYGICISNGRIFLLRSAYNGLWEAPGGKLEKNETPLQAMRREFKEEAGHEVPDQEFTSIGFHQEYFYSDSTDEYFDSTMHFFLFHHLGKRLTSNLDEKEVEAVSWFDQTTILQIELHPVSKKFIEQCFTE